MLRRVGVIFVTLMLAACSPTPSAESNALSPVRDISSLRLSLIRTSCFGPCPEYGLEIRGDGTVTYCGVLFVKEKGSRSGKITRKKMRQLLDSFEATNFFHLNEAYVASMTDLPTHLVSISYDGRTKSVFDYGGGSVGLPEAVTELENEIDELAGTAEWVGDVQDDLRSAKPDCFRPYAALLFFKGLQAAAMAK